MLTQLTHWLRLRRNPAPRTASTAGRPARALLTGFERLEDRTVPAGLFADASVHPVSTVLNSVATGDFNGDGRADLAVVGTASNTVSVLLANSAGQFGSPTAHAVGGLSPTAVAVGDFDGNGFDDIATANIGSNTVSVLLGNGSGGFAPGGSYSAGNFPTALTATDFNGDGRDDIAVANLMPAGFFMPDTASVLLANSSGGFGPATSFAVGSSTFSLPFAVAAGNFNGDNSLDLVVAHGVTGEVSVLLGNGAGSFGAAAVYAVGGLSPFSVAVGDFNGDGSDDIATANFSSDDVSVLLANGTGGFNAAATFAVDTNLDPDALPYSVVVGDFNGDGHDDLATANFGTDSVSVLLGNGSGGFSLEGSYAVDPSLTGGLSPNAIAAGDFDADGHLDLATANNGSGTVSVLLNATVSAEPVLSAAELIAQLAARIQSLNLHGNVTNGLLSKLDAALASLEKGNDTAATNQLHALGNQLEALARSSKLDGALAADLGDDLNAIVALL